MKLLCNATIASLCRLGMRARSSAPQLDMRNRKSPTSLHRDPVVSACPVSASERRPLVLQPSLVARSMVFSFTDAYVRILLASVACDLPPHPRGFSENPTGQGNTARSQR